jgi:tetratricopeptide (TPR) repeat protein
VTSPVLAAEEARVRLLGVEPERAQARVQLGLILLLTVGVFWGVHQFAFVYDDKPLIVENEHIQYWRFLPGYFTGHFFTHMDAGARANYYRPVQLLWFRINHFLFGPNPAAWHVTTLLVHLLAVGLLFAVARELIGPGWVAAAAALFFALHPVHVEVVAWPSGVSELLVAVPALAAFLYFLRWRKTEARSTYVATVGWLGVALLAKENSLMLPALLAGTDWLLGREAQAALPAAVRVRRVLQRTWPLFALAAAYLAARWFALGGVMHAVTPLPASTVLFTWPGVLLFYARLLVWPVGLSAFYETPYITTAGLATFWLPLMACALMAGLLVWTVRRCARAGVAVLWLVLPVAPLLNFTVFPQGELAHDRYLFLPSIGFCLLLAFALTAARPVQPGHLPPLAIGVAVVVAAGYGALTAQQKWFWRDNLTLYLRGAAIAPGNNQVTNNLANEYFDAGRRGEALALYEQVVQRYPDYFLSRYNLGYAYYRLGRFAEAEPHLARAAELNPGDPEPLVRLAQIHMRYGRLPAAEQNLRRAIALRPTAVGYNLVLGLCLQGQGRNAEAIAAYRAEMAFDPWRKVAHDRIVQLTGKEATPPAPSPAR